MSLHPAYANKTKLRFMVGHSFMCRAMWGRAPNGVGLDLGRTDTYIHVSGLLGPVVQEVLEFGVNLGLIYKSYLQIRIVMVDVCLYYLKLTMLQLDWHMYMPLIIKSRNVDGFFISLHHYLVGNCPVILGGDFNCVQNLNLDKRGGNEMSGNDGIELLVSLCDDNNLTDVFRQLHPDKREYTWNNSLNYISCRLDRFYVTRSLLTDVLSFQHHPINYNLSDHGMVQVDIVLIGEHVSYDHEIVFKRINHKFCIFV